MSKYFFESKTKVTEDDIKVTEDDIKVTEDDINGMLEPIYLAEFPEKYSGSGDEK